MIAYLDNSSTTRQFAEVTDVVSKLSREVYGNPSSLHGLGMQAEKIIKSAKKTVLETIGADALDNFIFTSGGTEANNLAILGYIRPKLKRNPHIITSKIEHPSVLEVFKTLEEEGAEVSYIGTDSNGIIDIDELKNAVCEKTELISIMLVNNEVGSIQPIKKISKLLKEKNPKIKIHVDAVQAFCKIPVNVKNMGIDMMSVSGHKIHGPKGIGGLYVKKGTNLKPILYGGHQQQNLRSGTENPIAIGGFEKAIAINMESFKEKTENVKKLKSMIISELSKIDCCKINCDDNENYAPNIINASFVGLRSETILHGLEAEGVYVSTGSACSSNKPQLSHVLLAMGYDKKRIDSAIRLSLSLETTEEEVIYALEKIKETVKKLSI
ncbi:MAG: cysteine desulfurase [Clostridia bacterium]|nr:cysteine desulfurase [Clostridia bacterium]